MVSMIAVMLGFGIVIPLMPFYITHFNASGTALGLIMSIYSLMQFLTAPFWGKMSDRFGRKPIFMIGLAGFAISFILQGLAQNLVQFVILRTLAGVLSSATFPTAMAYIADTTTPEHRSKGVGMLGASMGLGMVIGPSLGGLITHLSLPLPGSIQALMQITKDAATGETLNLSLPFFAAALLALVALPLAQFLLPESLPPEKRSLHTPSKAQQSRLSSLLHAARGPVGFLYILAFVLAFALANMEAVLSLYGKEQFKMGPAEIGLLMGAMGLLSVIQQGFTIGFLTRKFGEVAIVRGGLLISALGFVGMALAPVRWLFIGFALFFNTGSVLLQPSVTALISKRTHSGQGEAMGINNAFQALGRSVGPTWAGMAYDMYSTLSFWTGALIQVGALLFSLRGLAENHTAPAASVEEVQT